MRSYSPITTNEDMQLAKAIKQGDQHSLGILYDKYAPALTGIISRITNEKKLTESILHNSFLKFWQQAIQYNPSTSSLFTWLTGIVRKTAWEEVNTNNGVRTSADESFQHTAFDLVYYQGLNYNEAATTLQTTVSVINNSIKLAMSNLKQNAEK
ncbi:MAG: sigma factor [Chitinophagaceae bacterium]